MKKVDLMKNFRQVMYTTQYTVTPDQLDKSIREKLERAKRQSLALKAYMAQTYKNKDEDRI